MADKRRRPDATGPELFSAWIDAGTPKYRDFAVILFQQGRYKSVSTALSGIGYYSGRDKWQERKIKALDEAAELKLHEAARIDAGSFLTTSKEIAARLRYSTPEHIDTIIKMRESVRKPTVKTPTVNINLIVSDLAQRYGLTEEEAAALDADMKAHLAATKAGATI